MDLPIYLVHITRLTGKKEDRRLRQEEKPAVGDLIQVDDLRCRVEKVGPPPPKTEWCSGRVWCVEEVTQ